MNFTNIQVQTHNSNTVPHQSFSDVLLTTQELMGFLKVKHKKTIYELVNRGMPKINVGRHYRYIKSEVIDYLRKNQT